MPINWFQDLSDLFKTERARTVIRIEGNKINCVWLDYKMKPIKRYQVKFKSSSKLKKFWEIYMLSGIIKYHRPEKLYWSEQLVSVKKFR